MCQATACTDEPDTPAVAHAVARFGSGGVVPFCADVMADFPIEALRLPDDVLASLRLMGFERVGPLAAAARARSNCRCALSGSIAQGCALRATPISPAAFTARGSGPTAAALR